MKKNLRNRILAIIAVLLICGIWDHRPSLRRVRQGPSGGDPEAHSPWVGPEGWGSPHSPGASVGCRQRRDRQPGGNDSAGPEEGQASVRPGREARSGEGPAASPGSRCSAGQPVSGSLVAGSEVFQRIRPFRRIGWQLHADDEAECALVAGIEDGDSRP